MIWIWCSYRDKKNTRLSTTKSIICVHYYPLSQETQSSTFLLHPKFYSTQFGLVTWRALAGCNWTVLWPIRWRRVHSNISKIGGVGRLTVTNRVHHHKVLWTCTKVGWAGGVVLANELMHNLHDVIVWFGCVCGRLKRSHALQRQRAAGKDWNTTADRRPRRWVCNWMTDGIWWRAIWLQGLIAMCIWHRGMNTWSSWRWSWSLVDGE